MDGLAVPLCVWGGVHEPDGVSVGVGVGGTVSFAVSVGLAVPVMVTDDVALTAPEADRDGLGLRGESVREGVGLSERLPDGQVGVLVVPVSDGDLDAVPEAEAGLPVPEARHVRDSVGDRDGAQVAVGTEAVGDCVVLRKRVGVRVAVTVGATLEVGVGDAVGAMHRV